MPKRNLWLLLLVVTVGCVAAGNVVRDDDSPGPFLEKMFASARTHRTDDILQYRSKVDGSQSMILKAGYALALYISDPTQYQAQFVRSFPTDREGLSSLINLIESKNLTPRFMYSVEALGEIAATGDAVATEKIVRASGQADGGPGEVICAEFSKIVKRAPGAVVKSFSSMDEARRREGYVCLELLDPVDIPIVRARLIAQRKNEQSAKKRAVVDE